MNLITPAWHAASKVGSRAPKWTQADQHIHPGKHYPLFLIDCIRWANKTYNTWFALHSILVIYNTDTGLFIHLLIHYKQLSYINDKYIGLWSVCVLCVVHSMQEHEVWRYCVDGRFPDIQREKGEVYRGGCFTACSSCFDVSSRRPCAFVKPLSLPLSVCVSKTAGPLATLPLYSRFPSCFEIRFGRVTLAESLSFPLCVIAHKH